MVERSNPDRARVEAGMALLGRMVAEAWARDAALCRARDALSGAKGDKDPQSIPTEEERRDAAD
jgi:hypothetical protein